MLAVVSDWLCGKIDTPEFLRRYWVVRRQALNQQPESFTGRDGDLFSNIDTATDAFADPPVDRYSIDEKQLRLEVERAFRLLTGATDGS